MTALGVRFVPRNAIAFLAFTYAFGTVLGVIGFVMSAFGNRGHYDLQWWEFLLAPFAIGGAALMAEAIGTFCASGFNFGHTASPTRQLAGKITIIALLIALVIGWPMYKLSRL